MAWYLRAGTVGVLRAFGEHGTDVPPLLRITFSCHTFHQMIDPMRRHGTRDDIDMAGVRREQSRARCSAVFCSGLVRSWSGTREQEEQGWRRNAPAATAAVGAGGGDGVGGYLSLLAFMKLGPCLRNSVVSPKSGHPIVPGGRPRRRLYRTSFHRSSRLLATTAAAARTTNRSSSAIFLARALSPRCASKREEEGQWWWCLGTRQQSKERGGACLLLYREPSRPLYRPRPPRPVTGRGEGRNYCHPAAFNFYSIYLLQKERKRKSFYLCIYRALSPSLKLQAAGCR